MYKDGLWARKVIEAQKDDGSWGFFHTLSEPRKNLMTTEQALKRLEILGYTYEDEVIQKAVSYMDKCLTGQMKIPDYREKHEHWDVFVELMLSTWIRRFTTDNKRVNAIASQWAEIITATFKNHIYSRQEFDNAYKATFGLKAKKKVAYEIRRFYNVSLAVDLLDPITEECFFDYILDSDFGIYYISENPLKVLPKDFQSKQTSRYLAAIDMMAEFKKQREKLTFVCDWLESKRLDNGSWDMGKEIKDNVYFPLSDDWRKPERRVNDCTYSIDRLLRKIKG